MCHTNEFFLTLFGSVCSDTKAAEPMFEQDVDRLAQCCPPTLTGYRDAALFYTTQESGARTVGFTGAI